MSPFARKSLPPRVLVGLGAITILATNFMNDQSTLQAGLRILGGVAALIGAGWFMMILRAARRG